MKTTQFKRVLLLTALALSGIGLFAQNSFTVSGKIVNSDKKGVCNAVIYLLDSKTMEIVGNGICNNNGRFTIENIKQGDFILSVSKPGFRKISIKYISIDEYGKLIDNTAFVLKSNPDLKTETDLI